MRDKIKFIKELAESMNANKIDTVKYEENDFEIQITKKEKERKVFFMRLAIVIGPTPPGTGVI